MRPTNAKQDPLKAPLNQILASEVNVRILRELSATEHPMGRATVARRARLNASGVRRSLDRLARLGLVEITGSGRNQAVGLRDRHPLAQPLRQLFQAEREIYERLVKAVQAAVMEGDSLAQAVWLESPEERSPGTVDVGVLATPDHIDDAVRSVEAGLQALAPEIVTSFVVHGYTDADLLVADAHTGRRLRDVTLLMGWIPSRWREPGGGPIRSHRDLEARSLEMGRWIADQLTNDPAILSNARHWIDRQLTARPGPGTRDLEEWKQILSDLSIRQIQSLLREDSPRATRLRQSSPFLEAMTAADLRRSMKEATQ